MKLMPRSLVARMTALVVAVGVLSLAVHVLVMYLWTRPLLYDITGMLSARVKLTRDLLAATPAAERDALAQRLSVERHTIKRAQGESPLASEPPVVPHRLPTLLREELDAGIRVSFGTIEEPERRGLIVFDFDVDGEPWRVVNQAVPPVRALVGSGLAWLSLVVMGVFASLLIGMRFISRPIAQVTQAIGRQGSSVQPLDMRTAGRSTEMQTLVSSFNRLANAVQQADREKQQLLAGVSHDLRTPLSRLRLRIETELTAAESDKLMPDLQSIDRIVSQFLAYVQGDTQTALGELEPLPDLVRHVVHSYAVQGLPVSVHIDETALTARDLAVQRVLGNLIDNALAHGRSPVDVTLVESDGGVVLTVWDHGAGMTAGEFERAQKPFVRLASVSDRLGHCGLGLAIVGQILRQLGARLELARGNGGRFGVAILWPAGGSAAR